MQDPKKPRAFRLQDLAVEDADSREAPRAPVLIEPARDPYEAEAEALLDPAPEVEEEAAVEAAQRQGLARHWLLSWGGVFWSAASGLLLLGLGAWVSAFIDDLFARAPALGALALALAGLCVLALLVLAAREAAGVLRQRRIADLHAGFAQAREADDYGRARNLVSELGELYVARPETAQARDHLRDLAQDIVDGRDLIDIAERTLIHPLDLRARQEIADAAKRVSIVTAIAPRAILDVLFVTAQAVRLIRRISAIYGGRPGVLGFLKVLRSIAAHIAITGGMAAGDSLVQQVLGHGIAARLSAKLGEGVLNGMLTARVGLSAMAVCRPMPYAVGKAPGVRDVAPFLFSKGEPKS
ncbi:YcjF family protein [Methylocella sp.]|uniref:YcjF family protein n=1 Tax=Methylocella sp. TaxID=1978226 RepID=UPI0037832E82